MSTIDPDARGRAISAVLRPFARVAAIAALATGPVFAAILWAGGAANDSLGVGLIMAYIVLTVGAGILVSFVSRTRPGLLVGAYSTAYCGGLFLVMASGLPLSDPGTVPSVIVIGTIYLAAGGLGYLYLLRRAAVGQTTARGVDTTAEVMSVGVDGMVNYVQHQRMTLKFVDQKGTTRYLRYGRTGGGVSTGDVVHIRYDPDRPWSKRSIIVTF